MLIFSMFRLGMFLAAASGLLLTLYSALYKTVKNEIDNSTVLMLRGVIQVQKNIQCCQLTLTHDVVSNYLIKLFSSVGEPRHKCKVQLFSKGETIFCKLTRFSGDLNKEHLNIGNI